MNVFTHEMKQELWNITTGRYMSY